MASFFPHIKIIPHELQTLTYPKKYAFFVSQKSLTPTWGSISFWRISLAYLIRFSFVTPGLAPRDPMKFRATFCSCITKASSKDGFTFKKYKRMLTSTYIALITCTSINPLTAEWALRALVDFTLYNARRFYSSMGNPLDGKGINEIQENFASLNLYLWFLLFKLLIIS